MRPQKIPLSPTHNMTLPQKYDRPGTRKMPPLDFQQKYQEQLRQGT